MSLRPFLKWAGNKFHVIETIKKNLPPGKRLIEPFLGSAAVFLNTNYSSYLLADANKDLINLYQFLQIEQEQFIHYCQSFFNQQNNQSNHFYQLRSRFNLSHDPRLRAALFLYLNKHCFNGLCRFNSKGRFNVPFGQYDKPYFPKKEMQNFLKKANAAQFVHADYQDIFNQAKTGDIIYCDPPYVPLTATANFTRYAQNDFSLSDQKNLAKLAESVAAKGVKVIISNHATDLTLQIYDNANITTFPVQRFISCNGAKRKKVTELLAIYA